MEKTLERKKMSEWFLGVSIGMMLLGLGAASVPGLVNLWQGRGVDMHLRPSVFWWYMADTGAFLFFVVLIGSKITALIDRKRRK